MNKQPISKNINNIIINPTTIGQVTSVCNNLQRATSGNRLITTSLPSKIISGGYKPIHHYSHSDGSITLFLYSGGTISAFKQNNDDSSTPIEITTIDQEPYCGVNAGFSVYLMTDDGAFRIDYNRSHCRAITLIGKGHSTKLTNKHSQIRYYKPTLT